MITLSEAVNILEQENQQLQKQVMILTNNIEALEQHIRNLGFVVKYQSTELTIPNNEEIQ